MADRPDGPRTTRQNSKLWPVLRDIARQVEWPVQYDGAWRKQLLDEEDWKHILTAGLEKQQRMAQGIEGGFVLLGESTSSMSRRRMVLLLELAIHFGDAHGVRWSDPEWRAQAAADADELRRIEAIQARAAP